MHKLTKRATIIYIKSYCNNSLWCVAASSHLTSSSATEKSVRFSDRDLILSTPEPRPPQPARLEAVTSGGLWPFIRPYNHQQPRQEGIGVASSGGGRTANDGQVAAASCGSHQPKVKSILKSCPEVTSFMLDHDDGTLVWLNTYGSWCDWVQLVPDVTKYAEGWAVNTLVWPRATEYNWVQLSTCESCCMTKNTLIWPGTPLPSL